MFNKLNFRLVGEDLGIFDGVVIVLVFAVVVGLVIPVL